MGGEELFFDPGLREDLKTLRERNEYISDNWQKRSMEEKIEQALGAMDFHKPDTAKLAEAIGKFRGYIENRDWGEPGPHLSREERKALRESASEKDRVRLERYERSAYRSGNLTAPLGAVQLFAEILNPQEAREYIAEYFAIEQLMRKAEVSKGKDMPREVVERTRALLEKFQQALEEKQKASTIEEQ